MEKSVLHAPTFVDAVAERARLTEGTAFRFVDGDGRPTAESTFAELDASARSVGALLADRGLAGERVLVLLPPGLDYVRAFLGCLYAGAVAVPLHPPTGGTYSARHRAVLADATPAAVVVPSAHRDAAAEFAGGAVLTIDGELPDAADWRRPDLDASTLAFLQYTSGSTSAPRGVRVSHGNLMANSRQIHRAFGSEPGTEVVSWLPPYHDMGLIGGVLQPAFAGCTATLMSPVAFIRDPGLWLRLISERRAEVSGAPDFAYDLCADKVVDEELDLSSWRLAFNGAEPVRARTLERFAERMAPHGFRRRAFFPCYGLAEATLLVSGGHVGEVHRFTPDSLAPGATAEPSEDGVPVVGCGVAAEDVEVTVVDADGAPSPEGTVGEIRVSGPSVADGYWGTAESAVDGGVLSTGDLGFLSGGVLHVTGRSKDLVVVRGRNHYPQDLELTARDAHPLAGRGAAAFALTDGDREEAVLVVETGRGEHADVVASVLEALGRDHGLVPASVLLVRPGAVPRTTSGKVRRAATRDLVASGELAVLHRWDAGSGTTAGDPVDGSVRDVVLALAGKRLGRTLDPRLPVVAQGMDSLAAIEIKAAVADATGVELELDALLGGASVDDLVLDHVVERVEPEAVTGTRHPLAINQQALWFLEQQHPRTAAQHIYVAVRFLVDVDADALRRSFQALVDRHPALRTALHAGGGEPYQEVRDQQKVAFTVEDAGRLDAAALRARLDREAAGELFSLSDGRVLRAVLLRRPDGDVLSLVVHHVAADMWSLAVMTDELGRLYAAETGEPVEAPPAPRARYTDLAHRQRRMLESARGAELWEFWRDRLEGCKAELDLPSDRPRPRTPSYGGDTVTVELDPATTAALRELSAATGTTLFVSLLSVFQALVHRYTGEEDFLIGVPGSGRSDADLHGVVGYFVNPLLIRSTVDGDAGFADHLVNTKRTVVEALAHQEMPFPVLVERLRLQREGSRPPGYQVMFSLTSPHLLRDEGLGALQTGRAGARMRIGGLEVESLDLVRRTAQVDLTMVLAEVDDRLEGLINFSTDLFDRDTAVRLGEHFALLARHFAGDPTAAVADSPMATDAELELFRSWNATATDYPRDATVAELFAECVGAAPDSPALTFGDVRFTYRELDRVTTALARRLAELGVGAETPVGLSVDRDPSVVVSMLAVAKAGGAYVPFDPAHPVHRLRMIADSARPAVLLARPGDGHERLELDVPVVDVSTYLGREVAEDPAHDGPTPGPAGPDGALYVMYTSGSSGTPKGVCVTHRNVIRLVRANGFASFEPGDRVAAISNAAFDAATLEVWGALANGGHLVGFDRETALSPRDLAERLRAHEIDTVVLPTPLFTQLVGYDPKTFATVRQLLVGGDSMDVKRAREVADLGGPLLTNGYGPTESATFATTHPLPAVPADQGRLPIGKPIGNTGVHVLDRFLRPTPIGVPGELHISGDGLGRGYVGNPELTAERFVPDPFSARPGARMYATGDQARWLPDGTIDFLGRADFQVKVRGFRIELGEVDAAAVAHTGVLEAVTAVDESTGDKRLIGYYAGTPTPEELTAFLGDRLPEYMVPPLLVALPALPRNPNGKIDRAKLPKPETAVDPAAAAVNGREQEIGVVLAELLGRPSVGPDENFFEIGGHSLLAIRLIGRLRDSYAVEMPLNELFNNPTARAIAEFVEAESASAAPPPVPSGPTRLPRRAAVVDQTGRTS